ncbi:BEN domain-containing protein 5 [Collichthys lucidus]|uniref:BEN domain-containing protein 5 n=1 Tax=Collichthys lucidus TaxID=240159 RepID=A0A4U5UK26_COLLU|nr:BEN domain-containing protein 5 [Collichthys lucidus]
MCYALPVSNVEDFRPLHKTDFDNQKVYLVHRTEENGSAGQPCEAQILALADTVEEFEDSIMQKKMKIPKMSIKNSGNSIENNFGEERMPLRHKKALSQDHGRPLSNSSKSLAAVVARLERNAASSCMEGEEDLDEDRLAEEGEDADDEDEDMEAEHQQHHHQQQQQHLEVDTDCVSGVAAAVVPRVLYEELVHSYRQQEEEMRRLQQELERTRRQLVQQAKKLKEYGSLLTEVKELRDFNRRLQDVLLMRLGSWCTSVEASGWRRRSGTSCRGPKGDSKFTKNLAVMIWGTETLKNRSVTGVATKKKKDALPKPPLSPSKLKIVRECLYDRVSQETADSAEITQRLSKVNKYICEKIMDINKSIKNEERRESKLLIRQTVKMENFTYDGM